MRSIADMQPGPPATARRRSTATPQRLAADWRLIPLLASGLAGAFGPPAAQAGPLTVKLDTQRKVLQVGALNRWDVDGAPRRPVDPKAKIDSPEVSATAVRRATNVWEFENLSAGRYDLVILAEGYVRIEGFHYAAVLEFDSVLPHDAAPSEAARDWVVRDIAQSRYYENKVTPLHMAGDEKQIRVLVQLLRDKPTSYDRQFGEPIATIRHEIWQFTSRYGAWAKEKKTKVLDRVLMAKSRLRRWTWIWTPELGGIELNDEPVLVNYRIPETFQAPSARGLLPY